jgi:hypothetical protein
MKSTVGRKKLSNRLLGGLIGAASFVGAVSVGQQALAQQAGLGNQTRSGAINPSAPIPLAPGFQRCAANQITLPNNVSVATGVTAAVVLPVSQPVTVTFSTEIRAPSGGTVNVDYSVDGGALTVIGPEFFADDTLFTTRTARGVTGSPFVTLSAGFHTIQPFLRAFGGTGSAFFRCFTAEP